MIRIVASFAAVVITAGTIAFAAPVSAAPAVADAAVSTEKQADMAATAAPEKKICVAAAANGQTSITGSVMHRKLCKTRTAWAAEGVTIPTK